jgi:hypothetical protein
VKLVTLRLHERPALETVSFRLTVPMKVGANVTVIVELPVELASMVALVGCAVRVNAVPTV